LDDSPFRRDLTPVPLFPPIRPIGAALDVVEQGHAAFGRCDIPAFLKLVTDDVDWEEASPTSLPYSGLRRNPTEVVFRTVKTCTHSI
jgi:hypothetical protein